MEAEFKVNPEAKIHTTDPKLGASMSGKLIFEPTNETWVDSLQEEETLLTLIAMIYHYDVGVVYYEPENFDNQDWQKNRDDMLTFCEHRLKEIYTGQALREWYKKLR
jgi:hypothetical protein